MSETTDFPWRMQDIGLMGPAPGRAAGVPPSRLEPELERGGPAHPRPPLRLHLGDHVGERTNTRYVEHAAGNEHIRLRYSLPDEEQRRSDTVRLSAAAETLCEGDKYRQLAHELHASWQQHGTVTLIRCSWGVARELTVCLRDEASWRSGQARDATREEIKSITANALEWF